MTDTEINIRYGTQADAALLAELGAQTFRETFANNNTPENMAAYLAEAFGPDIQLAELVDPANRFLIAESAGVPIGYAKLRSGEVPAEVGDAQAVELQRIYVLNGWLGRGVGEQLMRACLREAETNGHTTIWLGVWEHNPRAIAFYRKWGFEQVGVHVFQLGDDPQTDLILRRRIR
ncbi:MAG TPA: GNAT family N-acetyltransferase [Spirillospora sp.]|nr:GNAT family N-acetyltransferase [Spirillospora sp.]